MKKIIIFISLITLFVLPFQKLNASCASVQNPHGQCNKPLAMGVCGFMRKGSRDENKWTFVICPCGDRFEVTKLRLHKWGAQHCSRKCYFKYGKILKRMDISKLDIPDGVIVKEYHGFHIFSNGTIINKFGKKNKTHLKAGYIKVDIYYDGKYRRTGLHRILAECFIPNPNNLPVVNHKDCNKQNNSLDNLEWCTIGDNVRHAYANNLIPPSNTSPVVQYDINMNKVAEYKTMKEAADNFEISYFRILYAIKHNTLCENNYWKYLNK